MKLFIAVYTNQCKSYCDQPFFENLHNISKNNHVMVVDNTLDDGEYTSRIGMLTRSYHNFDVNWIIVPVEPKNTQFQRNVTESVNLCRLAFLQSKCDHFLVIESDVVPPDYLIEKLEEDIQNLPDTWGAIGALYYQGFHDYSLDGLNQTHHCLSGCTLYNGKLVREMPFRWSYDNLGAFPDAYISYDATQEGYTLWNDHDLIATHLEKSPGDRGHSDLNKDI